MDEAHTKGDLARQEILDAARRLFIANGFHGTSMRAIAREAGDRAVAGLYNHFPTKEAIFEALIAESNPYDVILNALEARLDEAHTGPDFIQSALPDVLDIMPHYYDFIQLAQIDMREFEGRYVTHLLRDTFFPRILAIIQRLQTLPGLKPLNVYVVLRMVASLVIGYMITERLGPAEILRQFAPEDFADQFAAVLLYGIADSNTRP
jgi:AcrR family transcriptional regulator